jgi:hypothetical protein
MASDLSRQTPWRIARNSIMRALAGILHALLEATCDGPVLCRKRR